VVAVLGAVAGSAAPPKAIALRDDPRFAARVGSADVDQPLPVVLAAVGRELKLTLSAAGPAADCRITLLVRDCPAGELLDGLAEQLDLEWRRTPRGYELFQNTRSQHRQEAERRAVLDDEWRRTREWVSRVGKLATSSPQQLEEREQGLVAQLREPGLAATERARIEEEQALSREARRPGTVVAVAVLASLSAAQVERLRTDGELLLGGDELPPRIAEQVRAIRSGSLPFQNADELPVWADVLVQYRDWSVREGPPKRGELRFALSMELVGTRMQDGNREWTAVHWQPTPSPLPASQAQTRAYDPDLSRRVELKVPQRPRPALERLGGADSAYTWDSRLWPAWPTLGEITELLHRDTGLEVAAECFTRARVDPEWLRGPQAVGALLDKLAAELDYEWRKDGKLIRLTSRSPGRDRSLEAPLRIVRPWQERVARTGFTGLDDAADLASRLTDDQCLGVSDYWGWYFEEPWIAPASSLYAQRRHLRLWATLSAAQRREALAGALVPVERMTAEQRRAFVTALGEPVQSPWGPGAEFRRKHPRVTLDDVRAGGFSMKADQMWYQQLYLGTRPDGTQVRIVARRPSYRPANLANLPADVQWLPVGRETALDTYTFNYHLAAQQKPARSTEVEVQRSPQGA